MDPHRGLLRALTEGFDATVQTSSSVPWASITFEGARHSIALQCAREAGARLCDGLPEREFNIPGHVVADIVVTRQEEAGDALLLSIEALTIASH